MGAKPMKQPKIYVFCSCGKYHADFSSKYVALTAMEMHKMLGPEHKFGIIQDGKEILLEQMK